MASVEVVEDKKTHYASSPLSGASCGSDGGVYVADIQIGTRLLTTPRKDQVTCGWCLNHLSRAAMIERERTHGHCLWDFTTGKWAD